MKIKILCWNIWIDGHLDKVREFIKDTDADIIGLQEVGADNPKRDIINYLYELGYKYSFANVENYWKGKVEYYGPAVFTKFNLESSIIHNLHNVENRLAVQANVKINNKIYHIFSTHLIHTCQTDSKTQIEQARQLLSILPKEHTILMGDFNATPDSVTIAEISDKLVDADPDHNGTWGVYPEGCEDCDPKDMNTKLDYIFTTKDIKPVTFNIGESDGSDHLPIVVEMEI